MFYWYHINGFSKNEKFEGVLCLFLHISMPVSLEKWMDRWLASILQILFNFIVLHILLVLKYPLIDFECLIPCNRNVKGYVKRIKL